MLPKWLAEAIHSSCDEIYFPERRRKSVTELLLKGVPDASLLSKSMSIECWRIVTQQLEKDQVNIANWSGSRSFWDAASHLFSFEIRLVSQFDLNKCIVLAEQYPLISAFCPHVSLDWFSRIDSCYDFWVVPVPISSAAYIFHHETPTKVGTLSFKSPMNTTSILVSLLESFEMD